MSQLLTHPVRIANLLLGLILLALPACTVGPWEKEFWNPPAASGVAPLQEGGRAYPIRRAGNEEQAPWPNLADVPARNEPPLTAGQARQALDQLAADRAQAGQVTAAPAAGQSAGGNDPIEIPVRAPELPPEAND